MERVIESYNDILDSVNTNLKINVEALLQTDNAIKQERVTNFFNLLESDILFLLFTKSKIKVFSAKTVETHGISCSLFTEELTLKSIFNNQTDIIKNQFWDKLYRLYIEIDKTMPNTNTDRLSILMTSIKSIKNNLSDQVKNSILKVDVNDTTNNMIDDIVGSFQNSMNSSSNPFDNIMNITNTISDKYKDQLQNGDIQLDKIIGGIDGIIPGLMKQPAPQPVEKVIIDENFSTNNVQVGVEQESSNGNIGNMMKMIPNMSGLMNMVGRINTAQTDNELVDIKKDMDVYLEKELKVDMNQFNNIVQSFEKNNTSDDTDKTVNEDLDDKMNKESVPILDSDIDSDVDSCED
jgi:hypothetical protein